MVTTYIENKLKNANIGPLVARWWFPEEELLPSEYEYTVMRSMLWRSNSKWSLWHSNSGKMADCRQNTAVWIEISNQGNQQRTSTTGSLPEFACIQSSEASLRIIELKTRQWLSRHYLLALVLSAACSSASKRLWIIQYLMELSAT